MVNFMDMAIWTIIMAINTLDNGKMENTIIKVNIYGIMVINFKELIKME
jgi:hypothetical protein